MISIAVLLMFPPLQGKVVEDQSTRAREKAESIAWAVQEYHQDTGNWPQMVAGSLDLACLTRPPVEIADPAANRPNSAGAGANATSMALMGANGLAGLPGFEENNNTSYLPEIPLDSWNRPFTIWILDQAANPGAKAVVAISAGPDGVLQTDPTIWPASSLTPAEYFSDGSSDDNTAMGSIPDTDKLFLGDDIGFILAQTAPGGTS